MKLFAQHGYGDGDKINQGLDNGFIDGIIFSARDIAPEKLISRIKEIRGKWDSAEIYFDPQFYVNLIRDRGNLKIGKLDEHPYYRIMRRNQLESEQNIVNEISDVLNYQKKLNVDCYISPNINVPQSLNSIEAAISKNFIRKSMEVYAELNESKPIIATLALSRETLKDKNELNDFLNDITILDDPPDGFYILVGARDTNTRAEIYNADIIAAWMMLNHTLAINGFRVINGYSDIVSLLLGSVGGDAGSTGWWSNLRTFSMGRFAPAGTGGRLPVQRYLSNILLNRILFYELNALKDLGINLYNELSRDNDYLSGVEPDRTKEVLQSWEALKTLLDTTLISQDISENIESCLKTLQIARDEYIRIISAYELDTKSDSSHLDAMEEGIAMFRKWAEI